MKEHKRFHWRGYYLSVRPVTLDKGTVSFDLLSGCKRLILKANRYSDTSKYLRNPKIWTDNLMLLKNMALTTSTTKKWPAQKKIVWN